MGYWDGISLIPLDFTIRRERGKNKEKPFGLKRKEFNKQHRTKRIKGTCAYERAEEADMSKIDCAIKMFKRVTAQEAAIRQRLNQRLWGLFIELMQIITIVFNEIDEQELLEKIFSSDEVSDRVARLLNNAG
jgi:hypothetical protein